MPPRLREAGVAASERIADRHTVECGQVRNRLRTVERQPLRDVTPSVVPDDRETVVAKEAHQGDAIASLARFGYGS